MLLPEFYTKYLLRLEAPLYDTWCKIQVVKNRMTKVVVSIVDKEPMVRAIELIKTRKIAKLPVTKEGNVVGIISGEDIKIVYPSEEMFNDPEELEFANLWNKHIVIRCKRGQGAFIGDSSM